MNKNIRKIFILLIFIGMIGPIFNSSAENNKESSYGWVMFRHDVTHTGYFQGVGTITSPKLKWSYFTGNKIQGSPSIADIDGDGKMEIIVGSWDKNVYCLDGATGAKKWSYATGGKVESCPSIVDIDNDGKKEIVFGSYDGKLYCLDNMGKLKWYYLTEGLSECSPLVADVNNDGKMEIIIGSVVKESTSVLQNYVYCIDSTGTPIWITPVQYWAASSPAMGDLDNDGKMEIVIGTGYEYIYTLGGNIYCMDASSGNIKWERGFREGNTKGAIFSSPSLSDIDYDGKMEVIFGISSPNGRIYCLDGLSGETEWYYQTGDDVYSSPAIGDIDNDGKKEVIVGSNDNGLYCLDNTGKIKWVYTTGNQVVSSPAIGDVDNDGYMEIVFGSDDGKIYCLDGPSDPPSIPQIKSGVTKGEKNTLYRYSIVAEDPDSDNVYYLIDWGDGNISQWLGPFKSGEECIASHSWNKSGKYEVKAKAKDSKGMESKWSNILEVEIVPFKAKFTYSPEELFVNKKINFYDKSTFYNISAIKWRWDFGDGNISYEQNPIHVYTKPGEYYVTLTIEDKNGNADSCTIRIKIENPPPNWVLIFSVTILIFTLVIGSAFAIIKAKERKRRFEMEKKEIVDLIHRITKKR